MKRVFDNTKMKLHLGAFDEIHPGWVNTDVTPHIYVARVPGLPRLLEAAGLLNEHQIRAYRTGVFRQLRRLDVTKRFPMSDGEVEAIHSSHLLTMLERHDAEHCLEECFRVLKPGGVMRLSIEDLDAVVAGYNPAAPDQFVEMIFCLRASKKARLRHWWHYNERSLEALLRKVGFREIQRCRFRQGRCPDVETIDCRPQSLFLEAVK